MNMVKVKDPVARRSVPCPSMVVPVSSQLSSRLATFPQTLARPSPSLSNRGLVIVQVQEQGMEEEAPSSSKPEDPSAHQLIHGYPPHTFLAEDEEEEEEEAEEDEDTDFSPHDESDEGYRTNSSVASGSPLVETAGSPGPEDTPRHQVKEQMVTGRVTETVEDEQGNLMWLVDFKLDFFNELEKEAGKGELPPGAVLEEGPSRKRPRLQEPGPPVQPLSPLVSPAAAAPPAEPQVSSLCPLALAVQETQQPVLPPESPQPLPIALPTIPIPQADLPSPVGRIISTSKPNSTYTDLITLALKEKFSLTVSGIYQWITENYPYFKAEDDRWKNSVRHNLSMNPHFRKGGKAKQGSGHVWVLADEGKGSYTLGQDSGFKLISNDDEAAEAVRKILSSRPPPKEEPARKRPRPRAGAGAQQGRAGGQVQVQGRGGRPAESHGRVSRPGDLQRCAEEILAGHGRPTAVEGALVQFLLPQDKPHGKRGG